MEVSTNILAVVVASVVNFASIDAVYEFNELKFVINDEVDDSTVLLEPLPTQIYPFDKDAVKLPKISISPFATISLVTKISL